MGSVKGNVIVIDDDPSTRRSMARLLNAHGYDVHSFRSASEFLEEERFFDPPSCVLLDVHMPGMSGMELQEELCAQSREMAIVFISGHGDIRMSVTAMKRGAVDFLTKPFDQDELISVVTLALEKCVAMADRQQEAEEIRKRLKCLTPREIDILRFLITGALNKQIGSALEISEKTVKIHRARVLEKMEAKSIAELVRLAEKCGIEPADMSG